MQLTRYGPSQCFLLCSTLFGKKGVECEIMTPVRTAEDDGDLFLMQVTEDDVALLDVRDGSWVSPDGQQKIDRTSKNCA